MTLAVSQQHLADAESCRLLTTAAEAGSVTSPGVYLRDDPVCGAQLENHSELRAPTAERAAYFLDAAIAARTVSGEYRIATFSCFPNYITTNEY